MLSFLLKKVQLFFCHQTSFLLDPLLSHRLIFLFYSISLQSVTCLLVSSLLNNLSLPPFLSSLPPSLRHLKDNSLRMFIFEHNTKMIVLRSSFYKKKRICFHETNFSDLFTRVSFVRFFNSFRIDSCACSLWIIHKLSLSFSLSLSLPLSASLLLFLYDF